MESIKPRKHTAKIKELKKARAVCILWLWHLKKQYRQHTREVASAEVKTAYGKEIAVKLHRVRQEIRSYNLAIAYLCDVPRRKLEKEPFSEHAGLLADVSFLVDEVTGPQGAYEIELWFYGTLTSAPGRLYQRVVELVRRYCPNRNIYITLASVTSWMEYPRPELYGAIPYQWLFGNDEALVQKALKVVGVFFGEPYKED